MSTRSSETIDWEKESSIGKRHTDLELIKSLEKNGFIKKWQKKSQVRVLNLSGAKPIFETALLQNHPEIPWQFTALESNPLVFPALQRNIRSYRKQLEKWTNERYLSKGTCYSIETTPKPCSVSQYFRKKEDSWKVYEFINVDYMGTVSMEKIRDIKLILESNRTSDTFAFAITLSASRGQPETIDMLETYLSKRFKFDFGEPVGNERIFSCKTKGLTLFLIDVARQSGWNCELLSFHPYTGLYATEYKFLFKYKKEK